MTRRPSRDLPGIMQTFTDDPTVHGHRYGPAEATGVDAVRGIHETSLDHAAAETSYRVSDVDSDGDTVSWDSISTTSGGARFCTEGHAATIEDGRIAEWTVGEPVTC